MSSEWVFKSNILALIYLCIVFTADEYGFACTFFVFATILNVLLLLLTVCSFMYI